MRIVRNLEFLDTVKLNDIILIYCYTNSQKLIGRSTHSEGKLLIVTKLLNYLLQDYFSAPLKKKSQ